MGENVMYYLDHLQISLPLFPTELLLSYRIYLIHLVSRSSRRIMTINDKGAEIATTTVSDSGGGRCKPSLSSQSHPLGPLDGQEISRAAALIKASWPEGTDCQFKSITLLEPAKAVLLPYLQGQRAGTSVSEKMDRKGWVLYYLRGTVSSGAPVLDP